MENINNPCKFKFLETKIDYLVLLLRLLLTEEFFIMSEKLFGKIGNIFGVIASFTSLLIGIVLAIKNDSFNSFLLGIGGFSTILLTQYISIKFTPPLIASVKNSPTSVSDESILDVTALISFLIGIAFLFTGIYFAIKFSEIRLLAIGLGLFFVNSYAVCLLLNPKLLNVSLVDGLSPARDFLGFISIFAKVSARSVAITYGSLVAFGALDLLYKISIIFNSNYLQFEIFEMGASVSIICIGISFPIISFFAFTFLMLNIQLMESVIATVPHLKSIAILLRKANKDLS